MRLVVQAHRLHLSLLVVLVGIGYGFLAVLRPSIAEALSIGVLAFVGSVFLLLHVCRER